MENFDDFQPSQNFEKECFYFKTYKAAMELLTEDLPAPDLMKERIEESLSNTKEAVDLCFTEVENWIKSSPEKCHDCLKCIQEVVPQLCVFLDKIKQQSGLTCKEFPTLSVKVADIIHAIFQHCNQNNQLYGEAVHAFQNELKELFKCGNSLHATYISMLENDYTFDLNDKEQLAIYKEVLHKNILIGETVITLNVKTMADQWRFIVLLCDVQKDHLRGNFKLDSATELVSNCLKNNMDGIVKNDVTPRVFLKLVKVTNFLLRILGQLFQIFNEDLPIKMETFANTMITIYGYCVSSVFEDPSDGNKEKVKSMLDAAEPLLLQLCSWGRFRLALFESRPSTDLRYLGYLIMLISIEKKLLNVKNDSLRKEWLSINRRYNIVWQIFEVAPKCKAWLSNELLFHLKLNDDLTKHRLYEEMLIHTCSLILLQYNNYDESTERVLYNNLLQEELWSATLASDLWVLMARYAPSNTTIAHIHGLVHLMATEAHANEDETSKQYTYIAALLPRLYSVIDYGTKLQVVQNLPVKEFVDGWIAMHVSNIPPCTIRLVESELNKDLACALHEFLEERKVDPASFHKLTKLIRLCGTCSDVPQDVVVRIYDTWVCLMPAEYREITGAYFYLFCALVDFMRNHLECFNDMHMDQILTVLDTITVRSNKEVQLKSLQMLHNISFREYDDDLYRKIARIFTILISQEDLKDAAMATFVIYCQNTPVDQALRVFELDDRLKEKFFQYLESTKK